MNIQEYMDKYFGLASVKDEEGIYRYFIYEEGDKVQASSEKQSAVSQLVMECDESNFFAMVYTEQDKIRFILEGTKLSGAAILDNEYEDTEGNQVIEKGLVFYSDSWAKRYLRVDLFPYIVVSMEIDYEQYETNPDGTVIWE